MNANSRGPRRNPTQVGCRQRQMSTQRPDEPKNRIFYLTPDLFVCIISTECARQRFKDEQARTHHGQPGTHGVGESPPLQRRSAHPERTPDGPGSSPGQAPPAKAGVTTNAPNKPNPGRGGLGIDYGLRMIDDVQACIPGAVRRQTKPISGWRRETGGRSGSSYGLRPPVCGLDAPNKPNLRLEAGDRRPERVFLRPPVFGLDAPNKPNLARGRRAGAGAARAKQTQFGSQGPWRAAAPPASNKANSSGHSRPGDPKLETRNRSKVPMAETSNSARGRAAPNKANLRPGPSRAEGPDAPNKANLRATTHNSFLTNDLWKIDGPCRGLVQTEATDFHFLAQILRFTQDDVLAEWLSC